MKSTSFALLGIILYAIQNAIIDVKLKQYSTVGLLLGWYLVLLPLALGLFLYVRYTGQTVAIPSGADLRFMIAVAVMFFIADFFYIGAYTSGGNAVAITILLVLMPVVAALVKFVWIREVPTLYHLAAFVCAFLAVALIALGSVKKPAATLNMVAAEVEGESVR